MKKLAILAFAALATSTVFASYDDSWNHDETFMGEYPNGFSLRKNVTVAARTELNKDSAKSVSCKLPAKATYHLWNTVRVEADNLEFVTYTKKVVYIAKKSFKYLFLTPTKEIPITVLRGETITLLNYGSEGYFLVEYRGNQYTVEFSILSKLSNVNNTKEAVDEWIRVKCASGEMAWLYLEELYGTDGFDSPNILEYGKAEDLK